MRLVRRYDHDGGEIDGAVHWNSMGPKLRKAFLKNGNAEFSDHDWLQYIYSGSSKIRFPVLREFSKFFIVCSCHSRTHWWKFNSA